MKREPNPRSVVAAMRRIKRLQVTDSTIPAEVRSFIFDNELMRLTLWPSWVISYTQNGLDYLQENSEGDDE